MGAGFVEIRDGEVMSGVVERVNEAVAKDGDWCIHVRPDVGTFLVNHKGARNTNGLVECEVQPPDHVYGGMDKNAVFQTYMKRLHGRRVVVAGTFVADCAHSFDDRDCPPVKLIGPLGGLHLYARCCNAGKTEIHPITSILAKFSSNEVDIPLPYRLNPGEQLVNRLQLFVFSDCASRAGIRLWWGHQPPHSKESRTAVFKVPIGPVG